MLRRIVFYRGSPPVTDTGVIVEDKDLYNSVVVQRGDGSLTVVHTANIIREVTP